MIKKICKSVYDTENAKLVKQYTFGNFGASDGYEERLYVTEKGSYFIYVNGGAQSKYPSEDIMRISKDKVQAWLDARK